MRAVTTPSGEPVPVVQVGPVVEPSCTSGLANVASDRTAEYVAYIERTGLAEYQATPGNRGCQMVSRDLGDGRSEVVTLSWWDSYDAIRGFAGDDISRATFYPEDDEFLIERETIALHYVVDATPSAPATRPVE